MGGVTGGETLQLAEEEMFLSDTGGGGHGGCFRERGDGRKDGGKVRPRGTFPSSHIINTHLDSP